jgi:AraC-like DNA-binding protein
MSGTFYSRCEFSAPWGLVLPEMTDFLMFHIVTSGECWLEVAGAENRLLRPGDLALVPHGRGHRLVSVPGFDGVALFDMPREEVSERYEILRQGGGGALTTLVCGAVRFEHPAARHLISVLPLMIAVEARRLPRNDWIRSTLEFMAAEAQELRPGGETIITRLADILVIQAIRAWIEDDPAGHSGWLGALRDRQIGRALTLIHQDPARDWSVALLASEVAMSRSAFAARFNLLAGEPPMQYVTRWRMHVALSWLEADGIGVSELAHRLGYKSEAAFSRAFKRFVGVSPGAVRRGSEALAVLGGRASEPASDLNVDWLGVAVTGA